MSMSTPRPHRESPPSGARRPDRQVSSTEQSHSRARVGPDAGSAGHQRHERGFLTSIKAPLLFSAVLGLIGGVVATLTSTGGSEQPLRVDIGLIAFGIFFIASLVVVAMLQLASKENPEHLSQGSGINRSSEEMHRSAVARRKEEARRRAEAERTGGADAEADEPAYGARAPQDHRPEGE